MPNNIAEHKIKCDEQCGYQTGLHSISWQKKSLCFSTLVNLTARVRRFEIKSPTTNDITADNAFAQHLFQCKAVKNFCLIFRGPWVQISMWIWPVLTGICPVLLQSPQIPATQWLVTVTPLRCGSEGSRRFRFPDLMTFGTWRRWGCQPHAPVAFTPGNVPGTHFH